jgi:indolepyruvate ferredoxin oxidoreductase
VLDPAGTTAAATRGHATTTATPVSLTPRRSVPQVPRRALARAETLLAAVPADTPASVRRLLELRVPELVDYQSTKVASEYLDTVLQVVAGERIAAPHRTELAEAVARNLFTLTAYKDEYEVARLFLRPEFDAALRDQFPDGGKVRYRLHPPVLRSLGVHRKLALGRWFRPAFRVLRAARHVRGTPFDVFGMTKVRRTERAIVREYRELMHETIAGLDAARYDHAVEIASLPELVRGYESIKLAGVARFRAEAARLAAR